MPRYLFQGSYTEKGLEGLVDAGGSARKKAVEELAEGMGGRLEAFYFCFGADDFAAIVELPSEADAAAVSLAVATSGAVSGRTTVLITPEEIDDATRKTVGYRPPGG